MGHDAPMAFVCGEEKGNINEFVFIVALSPTNAMKAKMLTKMIDGMRIE